MVLIDPEYVKERKVFGHVLAAFRYGREDLGRVGTHVSEGFVPRFGSNIPADTEFFVHEEAIDKFTRAIN